MGHRFFLTVACLLIAGAVASSQISSHQPAPAQESSIPVRYTDVRKAAGITFLQDSTQTDQKYYLETMGTGVGWIDYDQDGLMDLYFVQSAATDIYKPPAPLRSALYHNNGDGTFTDVTEKAGVGGEGHYGQGVAVGDFDNDGYPDLYVTGYGRAILYRNNHDGTFTDVTAKAGVADEGGWSTSAGWFDYDKDGWLDLVVTNYIQWTPKNNLWCGERAPGYRSYCNPSDYKGQKTKLYHNNHDGTFTDVSEKSGVGLPESKGMGVVLADFDNDGWPDIAIANDTWPNFLFLNNHDGTFKDVSLISGLAVSEDGKYEAGMGIDAADVNGDGLLDVYITHLDFELNRLYLNNGDKTFTDDTYSSGIGARARLLSGVAAKFLDYDNDGWVDILQLNGAMLDNVSLYHGEVSYKEPLLMFRNLGHGHFAMSSASLGPDFLRPVAGRGLATADFDNDGDVDIAVNNRGDFPELLRNDGGNANHWLTVKLIGTKSNRDGIGARLKLTSEGFVQYSQAVGGSSYMSASDPRIHFGLGKRSKIESLVITWPSGQTDKFTDVPVDQIIAVKEGAGIVPCPFPKMRAR
ncbi:MAG TPA: CRTAC1 family protein [Acidobacteriaceae bacterium]|nr:CRTAC1 family protein [Acidobacteriaceae bacterium]